MVTAPASVAYSFEAFFSYKFYLKVKILSETAQNLTEKQKARSHKSLFAVAVLQALIPIAAQSISVFCILLSSLFPSFGIWAEFLSSTLFMLSIVSDGIVILVFVKPYRESFENTFCSKTATVQSIATGITK